MNRTSPTASTKAVRSTLSTENSPPSREMPGVTSTVSAAAWFTLITLIMCRARRGSVQRLWHSQMQRKRTTCRQNRNGRAVCQPLERQIGNHREVVRSDVAADMMGSNVDRRPNQDVID